MTPPMPTLSPGSAMRIALAATGPGGLRARQAAAELGLACLSAPVDEEPPEALVARALEAGCTLLHPGEASPERQLALAQACRGAGLAFLGPRVALVEAMQDGGAIRTLLREAGVPLADPEAPGRRVELAVLCDRLGRVRWLAVREPISPALMRAPALWLTPEQRAYLGQLARQGLAGLELVGLVTLGFSLQGNRLGFSDMRPGLTGWEGLDEALTGLDLAVTQLRLASGDRLRDRQASLVPRGHALLWRCFPPPEAGLAGGPGLRLDRAGVDHGEARLLAWGRNAEEAQRRGRRGLTELFGAERAGAMLVPLAPL
ncbi:hypothetical protein [Halomonas sp. Y3]|uniref:ATP-binding protein n=1 Tax=Halomonas sp. Y3 TaxID=2956797 RepID=UPI00209C77AE|nr:hypothetical protein [Halomonas sp. Y3]